MTDRDAAVDRAIEEYGDARVRFADYGDDPNRAALVKQMLDDASAAVRAAVEQAIADARIEALKSLFDGNRWGVATNMHNRAKSALAELERQRGQNVSNGKS